MNYFSGIGVPELLSVSAEIELRIQVLWHTLLLDFVDAENIFNKHYTSLFPATLIELSRQELQ